MSEPRERRSREDYERGLPDHHDPTAGIGGAPPAQSALTLRLVLAVIGLVACILGGVAVLVAGAPVSWAVVLLVVGVVAAVDIAVILRRKGRGEPG